MKNKIEKFISNYWGLILLIIFGIIFCILLDLDWIRQEEQMYDYWPKETVK